MTKMEITFLCIPFGFAFNLMLIANPLIHEAKEIRLSSANESRILQQLLATYDPMVIPTHTEIPITVRVGLYISDMVPIEPLNMHYSIDMYFRQYWVDERLAYKHLLQIDPRDTVRKLAFDASFLERVWKPDLYFPLVKLGKKGSLTRSNELFRLSPDGEIFTSQRLHLTSFCAMDMHDFPFDRQICEFPIESYSYSTKYIILDWVEGTPIFAPVFKNMLEFTFDKLEYKRRVKKYAFDEEFVELLVVFQFSRNINYYLLQMYLPCILIVILSWVGFWIDYRSTPARVALGITTVLTQITFITSSSNRLPFANYTRLIDIYFLICLFYVFMALVEFAIVGITDQKWKKKIQNLTSNVLGKPKETKKSSLLSTDLSLENVLEDLEDDVFESEPRTARSLDGSSDILYDEQNQYGKGLINRALSEDSIQNNIMNGSLNSHQENGRFSKEHSNTTTPRNGENLRKNETTNKEEVRRRWRRLRSLHSARKRINDSLFERQQKRKEVHIIDRIARVLSPLTFFIFNLIYFIFAYVTRNSQKS